jgi:hypothetical protein
MKAGASRGACLCDVSGEFAGTRSIFYHESKNQRKVQPDLSQGTIATRKVGGFYHIFMNRLPETATDNMVRGVHINCFLAWVEKKINPITETL